MYILYYVYTYIYISIVVDCTVVYCIAITIYTTSRVPPPKSPLPKT